MTIFSAQIQGYIFKYNRNTQYQLQYVKNPMEITISIGINLTISIVVAIGFVFKENRKLF
jgi:hypothetical protein